MKLITASEVIKTVEKSISEEFSDEQIGHINDFLMEKTYEHNIGKGLVNVYINANSIKGGIDNLNVLASLLTDAGWNVCCVKRGGKILIRVKLPSLEI